MALIRLADRLTKTLMIFGAAWAFVLCFFILADIVLRALDMPVSGTKELVANSVVIIVFLQFGFAVRSDSMLRADFLVDAMPRPVRKTVVVAGLLLGAAFCFLLLKAGITPALRSFAGGEYDGEGALRVPVWPARFAILLGAGLAGLNYLLLALSEVLGARVEKMQL
ncbi:MAG: TRAP transporter small permease [Alphaproteobacteria bacterium]|nr:MAG: TRAP transporter small permease [Alphaproteobacteria bacterium]